MTSAVAQQQLPPTDEARAERLLAEAAARVSSLRSYACTVLCQERLGGTLRRQERIESLFRAPTSVYLRWVAGPFEGLQASHLPERDGPHKFMARESGLKGLVGALSLHHQSKLVDQLYPHHFRTHETSLHHLVGLAVELQRKARAAGTLRVLHLEEVDDALLKRRATRVDLELSKDPRDGLRWPRTELFFEHQSQLPLHLRLHDFDGTLAGEYAFVDLRPNLDVPTSAFELKRR